MLADLFTGLIEQRTPKTVILKRTFFGLKAAAQFAILIRKFSTSNVEEFRLEYCDIASPVLNQVLEATANNTHIETLALVGLQLDPEHVKHISKIVTTGAKYLRSIDISHSKLTVTTITPLLASICTNKKLKSVSLAYNSLLENSTV